MSNAPYLMHGARDGLRFGHASLQDSMIQTACGTPSTTTTWALPPRTSPTPSTSAASAGRLRRQLPAQSGGCYRRRALSRGDRPGQRPAGQKPPRFVTDDEQPRPETSEQQLAQLRPAFRPADGSVTAGNAS